MVFYTPQEDTNGLKQIAETRNDLPHVLILGDSISVGYTESVRIILANICNVHRPDANCGDTKNGLANIEAWLGDRHWDLIHFNWGLHDLCYRHPDSQVYGHRDKVNGVLSVDTDLYSKNLEQLVKIMQSKSTQLVWASTTFVPEGEAGRKQGDDRVYNSIADAVMLKNDIPCDDLYSLTQGFTANLFRELQDVHFTKEGNLLLAQAVANSIQKYL